MTNSNQPITAVLFDLSGTLIDEGYISASFGAVTGETRRRWGVEPAAFMAAFLPTFDVPLPSTASVPTTSCAITCVRRWTAPSCG